MRLHRFVTVNVVLAGSVVTDPVERRKRPGDEATELRLSLPEWASPRLLCGGRDSGHIL
jgi:hypothetical protein